MEIVLHSTWAGRRRVNRAKLILGHAVVEFFVGSHGWAQHGERGRRGLRSRNTLRDKVRIRLEVHPKTKLSGVHNRSFENRNKHRDLINLVNRDCAQNAVCVVLLVRSLHFDGLLSRVPCNIKESEPTMPSRYCPAECKSDDKVFRRNCASCTGSVPGMAICAHHR